MHEVIEGEKVAIKSNENDTELSANVTRQKLFAIVEALIFSSSDPISEAQIISVVEGGEEEVSRAEIKGAIIALRDEWGNKTRAVGHGLELCSVAGGYVFRTASECKDFVLALFKGKPQRLTDAQLEVLSVVAYRQPVTKMSIEEIRGVDCSGALKKLLNIKHVKILGKSDGLGRPLLYGTTKIFLEFFGLNSLHELPTLKQYETLNRGDANEESDASDEVETTLKDLFEAPGSDPLCSEKTAKSGEDALERLEKALWNVKTVSKKIENKE